MTLSPSVITPRYYQREAVDANFNYFRNGGRGNPLTLMPTGTGKSVVIAMFCKEALFQWPQTRILNLTHVKELIEQNSDKLRKVWPTAPIGIHSAGLKKRDVHQSIIFGGIASVINKAQEFGFIDLVLIDEAHLLSPDTDTMYQKLIAILRQTNPYVKVIGFTATGFRVSQGMLIEEGGLFTDIVYDLTTMHAYNRLIEEEFLCKVIPKPTDITYDVSNVPIINGDFHQQKLAQAVDKEVLTRAAMIETIAMATQFNCKKWLIFSQGIQHAENITEMLRSMGVSAAFVHSKMEGNREAVLAAHRRGEITALVNNSVLTTGYDDPEIDLISDLGPTASPGRNVQKWGRGTRPSPGKKFCLGLDFAGNIPRNGPINDPIIPRKKGKATGEIPVKICPQCGAYNHTVVRICDLCGFEFPLRTKIKTSAGTEAIIKESDDIIEIVDISQIIYTLYQKKGKKPCLWVKYFAGFEEYSEFVHFEASGYMRRKALEWWRSRHEDECPDTTAEAKALSLELRRPRRIKVITNRKYPEIIGYEW